ncbi:hypothetical protein RJ639_013723 [Escallonia herrerae]|uniref:ZF-HD dimerization-type domain-containing protein n=1 Tax=Escallonia herrerae TaxID=1293975 RepID=A0AA88VIB8_9ASTE|nr:hypothetical protein RJ639_013723 [Escallonia herrerae]
MEFEDHEEQTEEIGLPASYDPLGNSCRPKMATSPAGVEPPPGLGPRKVTRYRECLKNHAVGIGGNAVDGCGEFMPAGADGTLDALKCAACNCHRNFHRKEYPGGGGEGLNFPHHHLLTHHPYPQFSPFYRTPSGYLHVAPQQRPLALPSTSGGGGGGSYSREDQEDMSNPTNTSTGGLTTKKRHRTKFSQEQKDKMIALAEGLGWRIQKHDEAVVQQFCNETGVKRHVLKVWMHNNKHTLGKKP